MALEVSLNEALSKRFRGTCKRRGDPAATLPDRTAHGGPPPKPLTAAQGVACRDTVNRGTAYADGRVFYNTLDGQTIALDAQTGEELWRTRLGDVDTGETITMAPLVVRDKVLVGNSGGEYGVRGWIAALAASNGSLVWRAYSTGPDANVLIGSDSGRSTPSTGARIWGSRAGRPGPGESAGAPRELRQHAAARQRQRGLPRAPSRAQALRPACQV